MIRVFIDGKEGTTGLRIWERLQGRDDIELITLPEEKRKDRDARCEAIHSADTVFLCLVPGCYGGGVCPMGKGDREGL